MTTETPERINGRFGPGTSGNPAGRPKGAVSGRARAVQILDSVIGDEQNQVLLREALSNHFKQDPVKFFRQIIMPLLPQDIKVRLSDPEQFKWTRISDAFPPKPADPEAEKSQ